MADRRISTGTLTDIADAIRAKTGGSAGMTPTEMAAAIGTISGGGSGYAKKSGTFVLASDYTYAGRSDQTYTGSVLIETGLSQIDALIVWSEAWADGEAAANCFGISIAFPGKPPTDTGAANSSHYYSGIGYMRNGTNNLAASSAQGALFHSMSSNIPEGSFGLRCHSASFPIRTGHTIRWEAWGTE